MLSSFEISITLTMFPMGYGVPPGNVVAFPYDVPGTSEPETSDSHDNLPVDDVPMLCCTRAIAIYLPADKLSIPITFSYAFSAEMRYDIAVLVCKFPIMFVLLVRQHLIVPPGERGVLRGRPLFV